MHFLQSYNLAVSLTGGGIIAVSYEARAFGVTRNMRGDDAKAVCPNINICRVKESRGTLRYRRLCKVLLEKGGKHGVTIVRARAQRDRYKPRKNGCAQN